MNNELWGGYHKNYGYIIKKNYLDKYFYNCLYGCNVSVVFVGVCRRLPALKNELILVCNFFFLTVFL